MEKLITWPAFIQYEGDAELVYLENLQALQRFIEDTHTRIEDTDRLIDGSGEVFSFDLEKKPMALGQQLQLDQVLGMIKAHLTEQGSCCVAKLFAPSIPQAIDLVKPDAYCNVD